MPNLYRSEKVQLVTQVTFYFQPFSPLTDKKTGAFMSVVNENSVIRNSVMELKAMSGRTILEMIVAIF